MRGCHTPELDFHCMVPSCVQDREWKLRSSPMGCDNNKVNGKPAAGCYTCEDEECLVWSRVAALQDFLKLYGHIDNVKLEGGKPIQVMVNNH